MIEVVTLGRAYGYRELERAVGRALDLGCFDAGAVRLLLHADRETRKPPEPLEMGALSRYNRPEPDLGEYDRLLRDRRGVEVMQ